jgi:hypothetical protein
MNINGRYLQINCLSFSWSRQICPPDTRVYASRNQFRERVCHCNKNKNRYALRTCCMPSKPLWSKPSLKTDLRFARPKIRGLTDPWIHEPYNKEYYTEVISIVFCVIAIRHDSSLGNSASICKEISLQKEILVLSLQGKMQGIRIDKEIARKSSLEQGNWKEF